jgi:hypothetical protein
MKEPVHPHFVLSDAQYCHFLDDRLVIGKKDLPEKLPAPKNKLDVMLLLIQLLGLALLGFFIVMTVLAKYYMVTFTVSGLFLLLVYSVVRTAGFTTTQSIMKSNIVGVEYHKRGLGYDFFIINYSGEKGKLCKRRLAIYDSKQCLEQALQVMKEQGLLK